MLNQLKDALLGVAKLVAMLFYWIGWCFYAPSKFVLNLRYSSEIKAEEALFKAAEVQIKNIEKVVKKRAPRKKKVTENVVNTVINS